MCISIQNHLLLLLLLTFLFCQPSQWILIFKKKHFSIVTFVYRFDTNETTLITSHLPHLMCMGRLAKIFYKSNPLTNKI